MEKGGEKRKKKNDKNGEGGGEQGKVREKRKKKMHIGAKKSRRKQLCQRNRPKWPTKNNSKRNKNGLIGKEKRKIAANKHIASHWLMGQRLCP